MFATKIASGERFYTISKISVKKADLYMKKCGNQKADPVEPSVLHTVSVTCKALIVHISN